MIRKLLPGNALKGGIEVGSRVRIAAAACLVASGLFVGGASAALAFADAPLIPGDGADGANTDPKKNEERDREPGTHTGDKDPDNGERDGEKPDDPKEGEPDEGESGEGKPTSTNEPEPTETKEPEPTETNEPEPTETPTETEPPPPPPGECEDSSDDDCGPGWPWWPWPWPWDPGEPPGPGGGGGGGGGEVEPPSGRPEAPPSMQLPPHVGVDPAEPPVVSSTPGVGVAAAELPLAPITLPMIVTPPAALGAGAGAAPTQPLPGAPRAVTAEPPPVREPPPANVGSNVTVPASSHRIGYADYLRSAGMSQVVALAVPGVAGMLVLTGAGGLVGYRQAKAGHVVRTGGTARFVR